MTKQEYTTIRNHLCPYCAVGLPDDRDCDRQLFIHFIPDTGFRFDCLSNTFREIASSMVVDVTPEAKP